MEAFLIPIWTLNLIDFAREVAKKYIYGSTVVVINSYVLHF